MRLDVTRRPRVAVPVPGAAEVAGLVDHPERVDAGLAQVRSRQHPAEPGPNDRDVDLVCHRVTGEPRFDVGVTVEVVEDGVRFDVLGVALGAKSLFTFEAVLLAKFVG